MIPPVQLPLSILDSISSDAQLLSSVAIVLGAVFVVFQLRDDKKIIEASIRQANSSAEQARLSTEQLKQNYELSTVDLVTDIYDFANSLEFQNSWLTVIRAKLSSYADFQKLPEERQLAFLQVASLFESIGLLVEKGYVKQELIDDMFATQQAWQALEPFVMGMRQEFEAEDYYYFFEKLHKRLSPNQET
ncbi:MAG: DUF4760 domain-containing protein [Thaumarchaeota archaeon]|nr:DUF4760 domain-containing protein [Nitrososphaerota archaeon]